MSDSRKKESRGGAGAAGAGGGTLLIVIANSLPDGSKLRPFLIWAAPSAAISLGALWLFLQFKVNNYLRDREANLLFSKAKRILQEALNNPLTSKDHRERILRDLETLETMAVGQYMEQLKALSGLLEKNDKPQGTTTPPSRQSLRKSRSASRSHDNLPSQDNTPTLGR